MVKISHNPLLNKPDSLNTRIKTLFIGGAHLSSQEVYYFISEKYPEQRYSLNSVSSAVKKLVDYGFIVVSGIKTKRGGNIYTLR